MTCDGHGAPFLTASTGPYLPPTVIVSLARAVVTLSRF